MGIRDGGMTVAGVDNGIDRKRPSLKGRIVHEACISSRSLGGSVRGIKTDPKREMFGPGAGWGCRLTAAEWARRNRELEVPRYCFTHGTEVASALAARNAQPRGHPLFLKGIAPKIDIFFVRMTLPEYHLSTIAKIFEHVFNKRREFGIDAVTMSIKLGRNEDECEGRAPVIEAAINKLTDAGIPFFNSSGNDASSEEIDYPGCLMNVVSVAASTESAKKITKFSDTNHLVELLSPANQFKISTTAMGVHGPSFASPAAAA